MNITTLSNQSRTDYKVVLEGSPDSILGGLEFTEAGGQKSTGTLKARDAAFTLKAGTIYYIKYLNGPRPVVADLPHYAQWYLEGKDGDKLRLESYRTDSPDSNVFVRPRTPLAIKDFPNFTKVIQLNLNEPGNIVILGDTLAW